MSRRPPSTSPPGRHLPRPARVGRQAPFRLTSKGAKRLRKTLTECARSGDRTPVSYLPERYRQVTRRGDKKATIAVAHPILTACRHLLSTGAIYREQGRAAARSRRRAIRQLEKLGHRVTLEPLPEAA